MYLSQKANDHQSYCRALSLRTFYYYSIEKMDSALWYDSSVRRYARKHNQMVYYYWIWNLKIDYFVTHHRYQAALDELKLMYEQSMEEKDDNGLIQSYFTSGKVFEELGNIKQAFYYDSILLEHCFKHSPNAPNLDYYVYNCVRLLCDMKRMPEAHELINKGRQFCRNGDQVYTIDAAAVLYHVRMGDANSATPFVTNIIRHFGPYPLHISLQNSLLEYYMDREDYEQALKLLDFVGEVVGETDLMSKYQCLLHIPGRQQEGIALAESFYTRLDSINQIKQHVRFEELSTQMKLDKQTQESLATEMRIKTIALVITSILSLILLALFFGLFFTRHMLVNSRKAYNEMSDEYSKVEIDIQGAQQQQFNMLKTEYPAFPDQKDFDIYATMIPAKEVGGDLYDYILHDGKLYFLQGDVSGKGVTASLFMAITLSTFRSFAKQFSSAATIMQMLNQSVLENSETNMFVTAVVGILDLESHQLDICNAGHNPPLLATPNKGFYDINELNIDHGLPLGLVEGFEYEDHVINMSPNSKLFIFTDGVNEAENSEHRFFGMNATLQSFAFHAAKEPYELVTSILNNIHSFTEDAEQNDDITMMVVEAKS